MISAAGHAEARTFSVVLPTFRRPRILPRALDSLKRQTRRPDEVVVVTKSSDPESARVLRTCLAGDSCGIAWRHVVVDAPSILAAERAGIASARGDVVCFLDDDAEARADWIERMAAHYLDPRVGGVGGRDVVHHGDTVEGRPVDRVGRVSWFGRVTGNHHQEASGVRPVDFLKGCNMSFRRSLVLDLDGDLAGDVTYGFEIDLGLQARRLGHVVLYDPLVVVDHYPTRQTPLERTDPRTVYVVSHNQTYALLKHFGPSRRLAFLLYTHLAGDRNTPGILRIVWHPLPPGRSKREVFSAAWRGKRDALALFRRRFAARPAGHPGRAGIEAASAEGEAGRPC